LTNPSHESQLPPVLFDRDLAALLGMSVRTLLKARKRRGWAFSELPRIDRRPRWSRDAVLQVLNGTRPSFRRTA
jgi:hypothetical protein